MLNNNLNINKTNINPTFLARMRTNDFNKFIDEINKNYKKII